MSQSCVHKSLQLIADIGDMLQCLPGVLGVPELTHLMDKPK